MQHFIRISCVFLVVSFICSSCQKNISDFATVADSTGYFPRQIIFSNGTGLKTYYSFKYSANSQQIDLYADDTTNSNPYDALSASYIFNSSGYITGYTSQSQGSNDYYWNITIKRNTDNKIISIVELYKRYGLNEYSDTCLFSNANMGSGTKITVNRVSVGYANNPPTPDYYKTHYLYDAANRIQHITQFYYGHRISDSSLVHEPIEDYTFERNPNGSVKKIHFDEFNYNPISQANEIYSSTDASFSYGSGLADGKEDALARLLLGKDYYLQDIYNYPKAVGSEPYSDINANYTDSQTDPFHVSNLHIVKAYQSGSTSTVDYNYSYHVDGNSRIFSTFKSIVSVAYPRSPTLIEFRY